jgi:phage shock protein PspC (stress-responsive transcriptional regulator)
VRRGRLRRSRRDRILAGVCGGIAAWLGWRPWHLRLLFVAGTLVPVLPGPLVYAVFWLALKEE